MKNKKNIKILLPIVIFIWGILIYKIVDAFSNDEPPMATKTVSNFIAPKVQQKETFALLTIESDPFLGTLYRSPKKQKGTSKRRKQEIIWPTIACQGIVSGKTAKSRVYILQVNGQQYLVKKGDTILQMKVLKSTKEAIKLKYKGQTKIVPIM
ncbi:MAG: hypothetical protein COB12_06725 [Flavobacterium sp.]|nr:MAG: hypothetical protein COB12_06725 [Flavobacterium sp.]